MNETATRLLTLLESRLSPAGAAWQARVQRAVSAAFDGAAEGRRTAFSNELAAAPRHLGKGEVMFTEAERKAWERERLPPGLTLDELGRIWMFAALPETDQEEMVAETYRHGETRERRAVLRALPFLPRPQRFAALAISACRTHVQPEFEAICCENPYPASFFPDASFHQMVLKALFLGVALDCVLGLSRRTTPELVRMAHGYASERRAAGRSVPADIELHFGAATGPAERSR